MQEKPYISPNYIFYSSIQPNPHSIFCHDKKLSAIELCEPRKGNSILKPSKSFDSILKSHSFSPVRPSKYLRRGNSNKKLEIGSVFSRVIAFLQPTL